MSGITLDAILSAINLKEFVVIEDEYGGLLAKGTAKELNGSLSKKQLGFTFDYIRTEDGNIVIGMNSDYGVRFGNLWNK